MKKTLSNKQENYDGCEFTDLKLTDQTFENINFDNCSFKKCIFDTVKFVNCEFIDCEFSSCNLNLLNIKNSRFSDVVFEHCTMLGINWADARWPQINLTSPIKFYECNISNSSFFELNLDELVIEACKAHEVDFREASVTYANFTNTDFHNSLFIRTKLTGADFTEAINYNIDITMNEIKKAKFSFPEVVALLNCLEIEIVGLDSTSFRH